MPNGLGICFSEQEAAANAAFAAALGHELSLLCFGSAPSSLTGVHTIYVLDTSSKDLVGTIAKSGAELWSKFDSIFAPSSIAGKDLIAYIAGLLSVPAVTDIIEICPNNQFKRPVLAGSVIATVQLESDRLLATYRAAAFPAVQTQQTSPHIVQISNSGQAGEEVIENLEATKKRPDLSQAKVVVSGGKPLKDSDTFERVIGGLADCLGGAVGATRAAVDLGIAPNDLQVGQTGKVVAPDLYIACGISGATQHVAGIKDSKVIVAINKDKDAPIFEIADFGLVADLYEAIPELEIHLKR